MKNSWDSLFQGGGEGDPTKPPRIQMTQLRPPGKSIPIPLTIETKDSRHESVADLNGIAFPVNLELSRNGTKCAALEYTMQCMDTLPPEHRERLVKLRQYLKRGKPIARCDLLYIANMYSSIVSGYISKREQIIHYDWLEKRPFGYGSNTAGSLDSGGCTV